MSGNNAGWGFPTSQPLTFNDRFAWSRDANIGLMGGEIYVKTTGTCDTRTDVIRINRNLNSPNYTITMDAGLGNDCIQAGANGRYTINPNPGNVSIGWSSTWAVAPNTPPNGSTITLTAGIANTILTATMGNCLSTIQRPLFVRPDPLTKINSLNPGTSFCIPRPPTAQTFTVTGGTNAASFT